MLKIISILLVALVLEAVGVVYLSKGLRQVGEVQTVSVAEISRVIKKGLGNANIILGVFFEALFFVGLLILMSRADVSFIWPLTALGFVITTLAAKYVLHEQVSSLRWAGVVFIMMGAGLITWSEQFKEKPVVPQATAGDSIKAP
jgi:drug/metabolite transporter (DMT)-like permease